MKRLLLMVAALAAIALILWQYNRRPSGEPFPPAGPNPVPAGASAPQPRTQNPKPETASERSTLADALNSPSSDVRGDLRIVNDLLATFRTNFPHDGNPVGDNAEITAALAGRNRLRLALLPPDHPAINREGELCDRWGTPFFFHAESGTRMDVRSAGPDRKMFTADDMVFSP